MKKSKPFKKIIKWVEKKGYEIKFTNHDYVDYGKKEVGVCEGQRNIIYTILHECGHIVLSESPTYHKDFKSIHRAENVDGRHLRSNLYKFKKLKEEMGAWDEGFKLAKKLKIKIKKDAYDTHASRYFITYVKY